jgi:hypothetical protein
MKFPPVIGVDAMLMVEGVVADQRIKDWMTPLRILRRSQVLFEVCYVASQRTPVADQVLTGAVNRLLRSSTAAVSTACCHLRSTPVTRNPSRSAPLDELDNPRSVRRLSPKPF